MPTPLERLSKLEAEVKQIDEVLLLTTAVLKIMEGTIRDMVTAGERQVQINATLNDTNTKLLNLIARNGSAIEELQKLATDRFEEELVAEVAEPGETREDMIEWAKQELAKGNRRSDIEKRIQDALDSDKERNNR